MQQAKGLFLYFIFVLSFDGCKATLFVTDVIKTLAEDDAVRTINKTDEFVAAWIDVTSNHFQFLSKSKTGWDIIFASDRFNWFDACVC